MGISGYFEASRSKDLPPSMDTYPFYVLFAASIPGYQVRYKCSANNEAAAIFFLLYRKKAYVHT